MIEILERADLEENPDERRAQLTFVVGGGGFSGVETAGEVEDFARRVRKRYFPKIRQEEISAHLVELRDRILPEMPPEMGAYARSQLERRGFEVLTDMPIKEVRENEVVIGEGDAQRTISTRTVIWTGGVRPAPLVAQSGIEVDRGGRAVVQATMATSREGVFAIGDCAVIPNVDDPEGRPHAPTAQNAVREAKALARNIVAHIDGGEMRPFRYRTLGQLASIGHHTGVGVVFGVRVRGLIAWFMWRGYYWSRTPGFSTKIRVAIDWALTALFGTDPVQLKVEDVHSAMGSSGSRRPPVHDDGWGGGYTRADVTRRAPCLQAHDEEAGPVCAARAVRPRALVPQQPCPRTPRPGHGRVRLPLCPLPGLGGRWRAAGRPAGTFGGLAERDADRPVRRAGVRRRLAGAGSCLPLPAAADGGTAGPAAPALTAP
jgi:hypothetical protein